MFCFRFDLCVVLVILGALNKCCKVKVCVCIGDVYSIEEWFVWRLVWTVVPVSPWHCRLKYFLSFSLRSWHTRCLTCEFLKIHISVTESYSAECEKHCAGKNKCLVLGFFSGYAKCSVYSQVTRLASSSNTKLICPLFISSSRLHQKRELW